MDVVQIIDALRPAPSAGPGSETVDGDGEAVRVSARHDGREAGDLLRAAPAWRRDCGGGAEIEESAPSLAQRLRLGDRRLGRQIAPAVGERISVMLTMPRISCRRRKALETALGTCRTPITAPAEAPGDDARPARTAGLRHARARAALRLGLLVRRAHRLDALEQPDDLVARQGFVFQKSLAPACADRPMRVAQDLIGAAVAVVDDAADFGVDLLRRRFGYVLRARDAVAEEDFFLVLAR